MSQLNQRRREIRALNVSTAVPVPEPHTAKKGRTSRWVLIALPILFAGFAVAAIRGDEPTTVIVANGTITPIENVGPDPLVPPGSYDRIDPTTGDQLDVCEWDYCIVHDEIGDARIEQFVYEIDLDEATAIADSLTTSLGLPTLDVSSEALAGDLGGFYDPVNSSITLDEPIITWTLIHELAHHVVIETYGIGAWSHGDEFLVALDALAGDV